MRLFKKTLILMVILFGVIATTTSIVSGWNLYRQLTKEYQSKGTAIAKSIADSSVELLLNRDASTVQAVVDQFTEIEGVAYAFVADRHGEILSHTFVPRIPMAVLQIQSEIQKRGAREELITTNLYIDGIGEVIDIAAPILAGVAGYAHVGMDRSIIRAQIWSAVMAQQRLMLIIFLFSVLLAYILVNRISRPLNLLAEHAHTLASSDFAASASAVTEIESLATKSSDEIAELAESFVYMEQTLRRYLKDLAETTAAKERIESELKIAHDIQMNMVPQIFPPFPERHEFDIFATLVPAKEVGGDFYDFFFLDDDRLCFAVGDVSGKGVPAALFMALTKTLLKATASGLASPAEILTRLNEEICRDNDACMFVTLFCGILNIRTGQFDYSNGGHNLPFYLSRDGVKPLENTGGMALGVVEKLVYASKRIVLDSGEKLFLYTDGVTEAMDGEENLFSEQRLEQFLSKARGGTLRQIVGDIVNEIRNFSAGAPQSDDITALALEYVRPGETRLTIEIKNQLSELERLNQIVTEFGALHRLGPKVSHDLHLALEEILTNVISYAYCDDREHDIRVRLSFKPGKVTAEVEDDGRPFSPLEASIPDVSRPLEERTVGGLGIHLARNLMDALEYRREKGRNILRMKKGTEEA